VPVTQACNDHSQLVEMIGFVKAEPPQDEIYSFTGNMEVDTENDKVQEPLTLENTMWTNTVYASQGHAFGLVIYIGKEARPNMSSKVPRLKSGILDNEIDITIKILFSLMLFISGIIVLADKF
jgi:phospholipid-translocating ATPase